MTIKQTPCAFGSENGSENGAENSIKSKTVIKSATVNLVNNDGGLDKLVIDNAFARCEIYLQGAQVTQFIPKGQQDLLWVSEDSHFVVGKAIRGGIPLCWPWFGPSPYGEGSPAHGFVRQRLWKLLSVENNEQNETQVRMATRSDEQTLKLWPFEFSLVCTITIGTSLSIALTTHNLDSKMMRISEAIHSYFAISNVQAIEINHLENNPYIDKLADNAEIVQQGKVLIEKATDRIYIHSANEQSIVDNQAKRCINVSKRGANDTVVWNPWSDIAKGMADFNDLGYQKMVCVEAVNSQINPVTIEQGERHTITQQISLLK